MTKEEFSRRVEENKGMLYRVSCAYLRQEADRLDAVQEALLKAWQSLPRLKEEAFFRTWLTRIMIRECINIQRKQKRMVPADTVPAVSQEAGSRFPELRDAVLVLPEKLRIPVMLFYMEGYTVEEIAGVLHLPKGTVCSRLARARKRIREEMKEEAEC